MKIFRPSLIIFVCFVLLYLVSSCSRETVVPVDPELPADTITTPPVDTCADCGWERLEGIPLLGYGEPVDRREEARAHIEAVRAKLRLLGWMHDYNFIPNMYAVQEIALLYPDTRRLYAHARRMGATKDVSFQDFRYENLIPDAYSYLSTQWCVTCGKTI